MLSSVSVPNQTRVVARNKKCPPNFWAGPGDMDELPSFRSAKLQIWAHAMICTWRGHPNRRRVLFRGHLTSQASLRAVRPSFCSTRFVQFAQRCSSGTSQVNWSTDGVRYIIFSAACILQSRTVCSAIYVAPRAKQKKYPYGSIALQYLSHYPRR